MTTIDHKLSCNYFSTPGLQAGPLSKMIVANQKQITRSVFIGKFYREVKSNQNANDAIYLKSRSINSKGLISGRRIRLLS